MAKNFIPWKPEPINKITMAKNFIPWKL